MEGVLCVLEYHPAVQARQQTQVKQEQSDMKHQADLAAVRADQQELELKRLRSVLTDSSDLQDSARRVCSFFKRPCKCTPFHQLVTESR